MNHFGISEFLNDNFKNKVIDSLLIDIEGAEYALIGRIARKNFL